MLESSWNRVSQQDGDMDGGDREAGGLLMMWWDVWGVV